MTEWKCENCLYSSTPAYQWGGLTIPVDYGSFTALEKQKCGFQKQEARTFRNGKPTNK